MVTCVLLKASLNAGGWNESVCWDWRWGMPFLALAIYVALQALNPSHDYERTSQSLLPRTCLGWLPHSVDAKCTWDAWGMLVTYGVLFWAVCGCFKRVAEVRVLLMVLVVSGFGLALVAILENVSGEQKLLWVRESPAPELMGGAFVNRNNYAAYMNLLVPVALALGSCAGETRSKARSKGHPGYLFYFMAAVMAASVLRSGSRAGLVICVLVLGCWLWNFLFSRNDHARNSRKRLFLTVFLVAAAAAGLLVFSGIGPIAARFAPPANEEEAQVLEHSNTRPIAYKATLAICRDHWLYGTGAGTFHRVFPYYQPASLAGGFWQYAHCDWLQWVAELGVAGFTLVACVVIGILQRCLRHGGASREHPGAESETLVYRRRILPALGFGLAGVVLHACVDFPMHIPGVATLAVAYGALMYQAVG